MSASGIPIRKRCVVYFSGFDPAGARKYHQLYQEHGARMAPLAGAELRVGKRQAHPIHPATRWRVDWLAHGEHTETEFVFAQWDDVIREHWPSDKSWVQRGFIWRTFLKTHASYLRTGAMRAMWRLARPPALALLLPMLLMALVGVSMLAAAAAAVLQSWATASMLAGFAILVSVSFARLERRWHSLWLARSFSFTHRWAGDEVPEMDARIAQHAHMLAEYLGNPEWDEVLVVGHSSGSMVGGLALAQALRAGAPRAKQFAYLGLGHWWPLLTCLPRAESGREALQGLAVAPGLTWLEVSAAADGCCFAFVDPLRSLNRVSAAWGRPKLVSARWHTLFSQVDYAALKRDRFGLHFQYIQAAPVLGPCDFYAITAGPLSLAARAAGIPAAG